MVFRLAAGIVFCSAVFFYFWPLNHELQDFGDSTHYLILAQSIAQEKGFRDIHVPSEPPHYSYPPIYPLILSPGVKAFGFDPLPAKLADLLAALICFSLIFYWGIQRWNRWLVLGIVSFIFLSPQFLLGAHRIMAESILACLFFATLYRASDSKTSPIELGLLCATTFLTRKIGIVLIPAVALTLIASPKKLILFFATALIPIGLWTLREQNVGTISQLQQAVEPLHVFSNWFSQGLDHIHFYSAPLSQILFPPTAESFYEMRILTWIPFLIFIFASVLAWRERFRPFIYFFGFYAATLWLWPWVAPRFLTPLIPSLLWILFFVLRSLPKNISVALIWALVLFQLPFSGRVAYEMKENIGRVPFYLKSYESSFRALRGHLPPQSIIAASEDRLPYVLTGNKTVGYWFNDLKPNETLNYFKSQHVTFVAYDSLFQRIQTGHDVPNPTTGAPNCYDLRYQTGTFQFYEIKPTCR